MIETPINGRFSEYFPKDELSGISNAKIERSLIALLMKDIRSRRDRMIGGVVIQTPNRHEVIPFNTVVTGDKK